MPSVVTLLFLCQVIYFGQVLCLTDIQWDIVQGYIFSPPYLVLDKVDKEYCVQLCIEDPDCIGFYGYSCESRGLTCRFAKSSASYYYYGDHYTAYAKKISGWTPRSLDRTSLIQTSGSPLPPPSWLTVNFKVPGSVHSVDSCVPEIHSNNDFVHLQSHPSYQSMAYKIMYSATNLAWIGPDSTQNAGFTIDYGCVFRLKSYYLRQVHSGHFGNRGTKNFKIETSLDRSNWITVIEDQFVNAGSNSPDFLMVNPSQQVLCRYVRFTAIDYHGASAGLTFFLANHISACSLDEY